ncbi:MAG: 5-amino-6-(D-ribitylamino)uracil--L-tyrosine 4-hydroxyphenyl transferase CofH [Xanthobacteraceae bacterium]|nr:5-amino-6-(D-ribitylamino)uracil--L-tyrosine 4-hydroxyphenyl transferase CofH [Xanthobacteraceae bacterium]MCW5676391.1 5-amino-6-(D-ribitylamino)uracil--L-tyrosine 4-hydroxyphenyl transferase CofH [Xanthobacteraceae bacterium]
MLPSELSALAQNASLNDLLEAAERLTTDGHGQNVSYSRKVFIPLTKLCRDVCHYCTFAERPKRGQRGFLTRDEVLEIARQGVRAGCHEALFTLGDKPELRYRVAAEELASLGHETTLSYLAEMCSVVLNETGLLPHVNAGVMTEDELVMLRQVSVSQGLMLESSSDRLMERGQVHHGSPDKRPAARLETIRLAGEHNIPFTSGILIGIGETRAERIESLLALRELHERYGHIQEIIIQNFRAKSGTKCASAEEPDLDDLLWTIAIARLVFGPTMNIQAPPNLSPGVYERLIRAGINDWGGISPVTVDHVNPEAPWPAITELASRSTASGRTLVPRLALYPSYVDKLDRWVAPRLHSSVLRNVDSAGFAREDDWAVGLSLPAPHLSAGATDRALDCLLDRASSGNELGVEEIGRLFRARGGDVHAISVAADSLRRKTVGDEVSYVVTRNINYTNVCYFKCGFCAFSKGKMSENLRGKPYDLALSEITRRAAEAWERGATEVCLQGGIHPAYTGQRYLDVCRAVREGAPKIHIHAFSALEVSQGARTLGISVERFLGRLKEAGLGTLPGTAAEVLDDNVRARLCPDKLNTGEWLSVIEKAHGVGLRTTSTIMFGHLDAPEDWARHLLHLRKLQERTGGFTELVPLPFVHMESPLYLKGRARKGPTFREATLMHAVSRLALHPLIQNIQTSWVKMGIDGAKVALQSGANDLGGTLMNESISRAAGTEHGQELSPEAMEAIASSIGRIPVQRDTLYRTTSAERRETSLIASPLSPVVETPVVKYQHA